MKSIDIPLLSQLSCTLGLGQCHYKLHIIQSTTLHVSISVLIARCYNLLIEVNNSLKVYKASRLGLTYIINNPKYEESSLSIGCVDRVQGSAEAKWCGFWIWIYTTIQLKPQHIYLTWSGARLSLLYPTSLPAFWCSLSQVKAHRRKNCLEFLCYISYLLLSMLYRQKTKQPTVHLKRTQVWCPELATMKEREKAQFLEVCSSAGSQYVSQAVHHNYTCNSTWRD